MKGFYLEKDNLLLLDGDKVHIKDKWRGVAIIPKSLLDTYAEEYIKDNFEISDDGWVRKEVTDSNQRLKNNNLYAF